LQSQSLSHLKPKNMAEIATSTHGYSRFGLSLPLLLMLGVYTQVLVFADKTLGDPDTYWHIAVGRWIIAHGAVPHDGIFSATMPHAPWISQEWLAEIVLASLFDLFGWAGPVVASALCVAVALALLLRALSRSIEPVLALIMAMLAYFMALPHILARPHIFTLPVLVVWVVGLVRARNEDRAPSPWLAFLMILWSNLHGGYVVGLGLAALLGGEAVLLAPDWSARLRASRSWTIFGALLVLAALVTPYGIDGLLLPFRILQMNFSLAQVVEWRSPDFQSFQPLELWIMLVLGAALLLGWRLPLTRLLLVLLLLHLALRHLRLGELLGLTAPLLAAPALAPQLSSGSAVWLDRGMAKLAKPARAGGVVLTGVVLVAISVDLLRGGAAQPASAITPAAALAAVRAAHVKGLVLNDYRFGGYLIFSGVEPFIDGRYLYGDAFIKRYDEALLLESDQLPKLLKDYGITWTLISPRLPAVVLLDHLPGWRRLYADDVAVVHLRDSELAR
jgi:hypothetical protein